MGAKRNTRGVHRRRAGVAEQRAKALELRVQGMSLRQIAKQLGLSGPQQASNLIEGALLDIPSPHVEAYRKEIDERSRDLLAVLVPIAAAQRRPLDERLAAVDRIVKIDRELRQLHGLDAPTRTEISGPDGGPVKLDVDPADEILGKLASLAASVGAGTPDPEPQPG